MTEKEKIKLKKEQLDSRRDQWIKSFAIFSKTPNGSLGERREAWENYCQKRESFLASLWGMYYRPLEKYETEQLTTNKKIIITGEKASGEESI